MKHIYATANPKQILSEPSFNFSPSYLIAIHKRLFDGIYRFAGKIRDYDITKKEWVLNGDTVMYGAAFELKSALDYDFTQEKNFNYKNLSQEETIKHISFFISGLWQIHAFGEGNTRTVAVLAIKYLRSLGFKADNAIFAENSWYFRNALVRANYRNLQKGIHENSVYLERFFRNLLLNENNELKNRYMHIDYSAQNETVNVKVNVNQQRIIDEIQKNPFITQEELSELVGISKVHINKNMQKLRQQNIIRRVGADKNGKWELTGKNLL